MNAKNYLEYFFENGVERISITVDCNKHWTTKFLYSLGFEYDIRITKKKSSDFMGEVTHVVLTRYRNKNE